MKRVALLGSTGSIGTQTLSVVEEYSSLFRAEVLTANNNASLLIQQAIQFKPSTVVIVNKSKYKEVKEALIGHNVEVLSGKEALLDVVSYEEIDIVLTALVGISGLLPTIQAIKHSKCIALANKETLVVAGQLITQLLHEYPKSNIIPVDSEHSAIFQCLIGEKISDIEKIYITASGGPFRGKSTTFLETVTKAQALKHPNWDMGAKITIDSATLMNKGLEVIEAKWLFDLSPKQIKVLIHPQSIIHSMVEFIDGSIISQMGIPDMRVPIQYALSYPNRIESKQQKLDFTQYERLTFEQPDKVFKNLSLAYQVMDMGGNSAAALNAANEETVQAFLEDRITFLEIAEFNQEVLEKHYFMQTPTLEDLIETDSQSRRYIQTLIP